MSDQKGNVMCTRTNREKLQMRRLKIWGISLLSIVVILGWQIVFPEHGIIPELVGSMNSGKILGIFMLALLCEYIDSSLGMGYGTTLTPLLLLAGFEPLQIVPAILLSECITGITAGLMHHHDGNVDFLRDRKAQQTALLLGALSAVGSITAVTLAIRISGFWLKAIIGTIILSVGILILATLRKRLSYKRGHIIGLGALAAFNKGISGGGYGPLVTGGQIVSGLSPKNAIAITSIAEGVTCFIGLIAYLITTGAPDWALAVPLTTGALMSVPMATLTVRKFPEKAIRCSIGALTCLLGILTFVKLFV